MAQFEIVDYDNAFVHFRPLIMDILIKKTFGYTKGVIRSHISKKDRKYNGEKKREKQINKDSQKTKNQGT